MLSLQFCAAEKEKKKKKKDKVNRKIEKDFLSSELSIS